MLRVLLLIVSLMCAGCGLAQQAALRKQFAEAQERHQADMADCNRRYPERTRKPVMPRVRCITDANIRLASQGDPNIDLVRATAAQFLVAAEQYDLGKPTEAQYEAAVANAASDYTTRLAQRENSAAMASAAQQQANAATWQAYNANRPRTCNTWGNTVTCY